MKCGDRMISGLLVIGISGTALGMLMVWALIRYVYPTFSSGPLAFPDWYWMAYWCSSPFICIIWGAWFAREAMRGIKEIK